MSNDDVVAYKIVLVGDAKVGKTSLLSRWASDDFIDFYEPTVSPELTTRVINVDGQNFRLQVWDAGFGETDIVAQFPYYARNAAGAFLMYDLSNSSSIDGVMHWHEQLKSIAASCFVVVLGCKADLPTAAGVEQQANMLCSSLDAVHAVTSAGNGRNVAQAFELLVRGIKRQTQVDNGGMAPRPPPDVLLPSTGEMPTVQLARPDRQVLEDSLGALSRGPQNQKAAPSRSVKLVLLGEPGVGKSCLAQRLGGDEAEAFQEDYTPTAGPEMLTRVAVINRAPVRLQIWDASGNDLMENMRICLPVLQDVDAVIVLYDISLRSTFDGINRWFRLLEAHAGSQVQVMLVGHKADRGTQRVVSAMEGRVRAKVLRVPFMEFSSRDSSGLAGLLDTLLAGDRPPPDWAAAEAGSEALSKVPPSDPVTSGTVCDPAALTAPVLGQADPLRVYQEDLALGDHSLPDPSSFAARIAAYDKPQAAERQGSSTQSPTSRPQEPRLSEPLPKPQARGNSSNFPVLKQSPNMSPGEKSPTQKGLEVSVEAMRRPSLGPSLDPDGDTSKASAPTPSGKSLDVPPVTGGPNRPSASPMPQRGGSLTKSAGPTSLGGMPKGQPTASPISTPSSVAKAPPIGSMRSPLPSPGSSPMQKRVYPTIKGGSDPFGLDEDTATADMALEQLRKRLERAGQALQSQAMAAANNLGVPVAVETVAGNAAVRTSEQLDAQRDQNREGRKGQEREQASTTPSSTPGIAWPQQQRAISRGAPAGSGTYPTGMRQISQTQDQLSGSTQRASSYLPSQDARTPTSAGGATPTLRQKLPQEEMMTPNPRQRFPHGYPNQRGSPTPLSRVPQQGSGMRRGTSPIHQPPQALPSGANRAAMSPSPIMGASLRLPVQAGAALPPGARRVPQQPLDSSQGSGPPVAPSSPRSASALAPMVQPGFVISRSFV